MNTMRRPINKLWAAAITLLVATSLACGMITNTLESLFDTGTVERLITDTILGDSEIDFSAIVGEDAQFLFEINPFEDIIRWRFYATSASSDTAADFFSDQFPDFTVERDETINGERYVVLSNDHPLSSIYSAEEMARAMPTQPLMEATLLDIEVLNSRAHLQEGRTGIAASENLLPENLPADTTLTIIVYHLPSLDLGTILDTLPGTVGLEDGEDDPLQENGDIPDEDEPIYDEENGEPIDEEEEDDRTPQDRPAFCDQVLASGPCYHPYLPVVEGFSASFNTEDGIITQTVSEVREDGFTVTTTTPDGTSVASVFGCDDDGVTGWEVDETVFALIEETPGGFTEVEVEGTTLPENISAGDNWQVAITITIGVVAEGVESKNVIVLDVDYTAVGEETITVPAGTYNAMRIDFTTSGVNTLVVTGDVSFSQQLATIESTGSDWYVECIGKVRTASQSSVSGIANIEQQTLIELTDFTLP